MRRRVPGSVTRTGRPESSSSATNPTLEAWAPKSATATGYEYARIAQGGIGLVDGYNSPIGQRGPYESGHESRTATARVAEGAVLSERHTDRRDGKFL
ncbi:MAG: hypothetical protein H8F28_13520, partial [Fibrella sp.]|nr:hypothetical protein [Armatimonadota bacterium]